MEASGKISIKIFLFSKIGNIVQPRYEFFFVLMKLFLKIFDQMSFGVLPEQSVFNYCRRCKKTKGKNEETVFIYFPKHTNRDDMVLLLKW